MYILLLKLILSCMTRMESWIYIHREDTVGEDNSDERKFGGRSGIGKRRSSARVTALK